MLHYLDFDIPVVEEKSAPAEVLSSSGHLPRPTVPGEIQERWANLSENEINGLAENRHSAHTAYQTKWAVKTFTGNIIPCFFVR